MKLSKNMKDKLERDASTYDTLSLVASGTCVAATVVAASALATPIMGGALVAAGVAGASRLIASRKRKEASTLEATSATSEELEFTKSAEATDLQKEFKSIKDVERELERKFILQVLKKASGNRRSAAEKLGISLSELIQRIKMLKDAG